jgi:hypothetical protein
LRTAALASLNSSLEQPSSSTSTSFSALMKKRKLSASPLSAKKRPRNDTEAEVIVISDFEDDSSAPNKLPAKEVAGENILDPIKTLKLFRLDPNRLG